MPQALVNIAYLISALLFVFAFKGLSHPRTAIRGNLLRALEAFKKVGKRLGVIS